VSETDLDAAARRANFLIIEGENVKGLEDVDDDVHVIPSRESFHRPVVKCPCMPELGAMDESGKRVFVHKRCQ
jgi:hypothetical protein